MTWIRPARNRAQQLAFCRACAVTRCTGTRISCTRVSAPAPTQKVLDTLQAKGLLFACDCTRTQLDADGSCGSGSCRRQTDITGPAALRVHLPKGSVIRFTDQLQGQQTLASGQPINDFVVRRKDGLDAYQLAVVVDDAAQGIHHVVRGSDLLDTTVQQVFLQQQLGYPTPVYCHLPVITNSQGQKFSKQNACPPAGRRCRCRQSAPRAIFPWSAGSAAWSIAASRNPDLCHYTLAA